MSPKHFAHYNPRTNSYQSIETHSSNTASNAEKKNPLSEIENMLWLASICHDCGKDSEEWQEYLGESIQNPEQRPYRKKNHTTIGGQIVRELLGNSVLASEMIQTAIYSHHGLKDCVNSAEDISLFEAQKKKAEDLPLCEARTNFYQNMDKEILNIRLQSIKAEEKSLIYKIKNRMQSWDSRYNYGNRDFFLGMYERVLMSLLQDADRRDTEDFMNDVNIQTYEKEKSKEIWKICLENLEKKVAGFRDTAGINSYRKDISESCRSAAYQPAKRYQLTVPTGAGKTLSSLRFAVHHALQYDKKRIVYVAPYHSILEQNAEEIRNALGLPDIVLEHHCNIVLENEEQQRYYNRVTEDWSSPVIVTTAVQFLNTLFAEKTGNVRRMHSLCDSIIIIDEVQSLPVKMVQLFNMAMNFLTEFADSTVVLCTATQPLLDKIKNNRFLPVNPMIEETGKYKEAFKRTKILDCSYEFPGGMDAEQTEKFIWDKAEKHKNVLFIANTKDCAKSIFEKLSSQYSERAILFHLSTNMCAEHRSIVLKAVKSYLENKKLNKPLICVSTQLIEAGVDISFRSVVRSIAGLDSIIQAAGRCNRHKEMEEGFVYVVQISGECENISSLRDIRIAQEATKKVWSQLRRKKEGDVSLDSEEAIRKYYEEYFTERQSEMKYVVEVEGVVTSLVELLSANSDLTPAKLRNQPLKQAFRTAGEKFEVIEDIGKENLIVEYGQEVKKLLNTLNKKETPVWEQRQILRKLQRYTVAVTKEDLQRLQNGIYMVYENSVRVLSDRYYDKDLGVVHKAAPLPNLQL